MNIYITKKAAGDILSTNLTIRGCAMELHGLDVVEIDGKPGDSHVLESVLTEALSSSATVNAKDSDGTDIIVERHYASN